MSTIRAFTRYAHCRDHLDAVRRLLNEFERATLSPEMALRIKKAFGVSMDTLMPMQTSYPIAQARMREKEIDVTPFTRNPQPSLA